MIRINGWDSHFETNETRKLKRLLWVKLTNQHDSLPFKLIAAHPRRCDIFTAWILMVQVASKQGDDHKNRGHIPMSPDELGLVTGFPAEIFKTAIDFLKSPKIGWIEQSAGASADSPSVSGSSPENLPVEEGRKGREGIEGNVAGATDPLKDEFEKARRLYPGSVRGLDTEWENFKAKHGKRTSEIVPLLLPAVERWIKYRAWAISQNVDFLPQWKNFKTWINGAHWEDEIPKETILK